MHYKNETRVYEKRLSRNDLATNVFCTSARVVFKTDSFITV